MLGQSHQQGHRGHHHRAASDTKQTTQDAGDEAYREAHDPERNSGWMQPSGNVNPANRAQRRVGNHQDPGGDGYDPEGAAQAEV